jgi:hypothetical protein
MNTSARAFIACLETSSPVVTQDLPFDQIETHQDAFVVPFRRGKRTGSAFHAGVFGADGQVLPNTEMRTIHRSSMPTSEVRDAALENAKHLEGSWLFGGIASAQIGHIITRSMGMLWAIEALPKDTKLLFASMMYPEATHAFMADLFRELGIQNEFHIVRKPGHVEQLITAPDLFSEVTWCEAPEAYAGWLRDRAVPRVASPAGRKIYITRDRMSGLAGRFLCEDILEDNLSKAGFDIIAPEQLSLAEQFAMYAEADVVIAADGSALHILPFTFREDAQLFVIQRRAEFPRLIEGQLASFTKSKIVRIDAIVDLIWPMERADNVALVQLDFQQLRDVFVEHRVVSKTAKWRIPSDKDLRASQTLGRGTQNGFLTDVERPQFLRQLRLQKEEMKGMKDTVELDPIPEINGLRYFRVLKQLHEKLNPDWYLEVGTFTGKSLALARCNTIAVDPKFQLKFPAVNPNGKQMFFFQETSDDFFEGGFIKKNKIKIDFAFLDGMHLFEYLLRDFIETEKLMSKDGVIALHDCCPTSDYMATREFHDGPWTGDVWKTLLILLRYRPDLKIDVTKAGGTGLVLVSNLNPRSQVLAKKYDALVKDYMDEELSGLDGGVGGLYRNFDLVDPVDFISTL